MAMIDYGVIVFKNGKCITKEMFTPMKDAVGWEDVGRIELDYLGYPLNLKDRYFTYIGDTDATIGFHRNSIKYIERIGEDFCQEKVEFLNGFIWYKYQTYIGRNKCVVTHRNGYYVLRWKYKGDKYKVCFGHGVDIRSYKKWHIVNYYRSLPYYFHKIVRRVKYGW